jgi:hypothetical protein
VPVPQQLPQIPVLPVWHPDLWETVFEKQTHDQLRILAIGLLRANSHAPNLCRVSYPLLQTGAVQLILALDGTNVQPFHPRLEGRAFHSQSVGCTRCATYHSACLF